jgi:Glycosyltransferase family 87
LSNKVLRIAVRVVLACLVAYFFVSRSGALRINVSQRDSIAYWTAGRLLLHHQDPYDSSKVFKMERDRGYPYDKPLVLRTPPWSLFMVLTLGALSAFWAWLLWLGISVGVLIFAMRLCWKLYGAANLPQNAFWLVGYTFAPVPACLVAGQMGVMLLIGLMLFLWWETDRPFLAGAALILPFAKPHLLSVFWIGILFWIVLRRKSAVAAGFAIALLLAIAVACVFDPSVFSHYRQMLVAASIANEFIPAFSGVVRLIFFRRLFWVQFIPMALGVAWCLWFLFRKRMMWDWRQDGPALLVVSILVTPYSWLTDEVVLLPAMLQALAFVYAARWRTTILRRIALVSFAGLNVLLLLILIAKIPFATGIYFWSSIVWFAWYFYARRQALQVASQASAATAPVQQSN